MNTVALIDSNILVYAFDRSERKKHEICAELLDKCWLGGEKYAISLQNLSEFYVTVTQKINEPMEKEFAELIAKRIIEFNNFIILEPNENTILSAIEINKKYNLHYFDALLAATMRENGIFKIYTEDANFDKIPWIENLNPV